MSSQSPTGRSYSKGRPTARLPVTSIKLIKAGSNAIVDFDGEQTEAGFAKFLKAQVVAEGAAAHLFLQSPPLLDNLPRPCMLLNRT